MKTQIGFLLFPGLLQLDLTGPYGVLSAGPDAEINLIWKEMQPVISSDKLVLKPSITFSDCPALDVLCIPGGSGITPLLQDNTVLQYIREMAKKVQFVTSVCTGALVLGASGLLQGYRATTHWQSLDFLEYFGAIPEHARVVEDRNRITAAGVSAGIDMALLLAAKLWSTDIAQQIQLSMEYSPEPPFTSGTPSSAPAHILRAVQEKTSQRQQDRKNAVLAASGNC